MGTSGREAFDPFTVAIVSHESSNAHAKKAMLVVVAELPLSGEKITVEEGIAEID